MKIEVATPFFPRGVPILRIELQRTLQSTFSKNFFWMFVQILRAIQEGQCFFPTLNINRSRKLPYSFPLHPSVLYAYIDLQRPIQTYIDLQRPTQTYIDLYRPTTQCHRGKILCMLEIIKQSCIFIRKVKMQNCKEIVIFLQFF